jgi:hypothetical protein
MPDDRPPSASNPTTARASESLARKSVRTSPVLWILGAIFAGFLGWLGTQGLSDIADLFHEPMPSEFNRPRIESLERERNSLNETPDPRPGRIERAQSDLAALERSLATAEQNWKTWLDTRATLGANAADDKEVRARRNQLDSLRNDRDQAEAALQLVRREPDPRTEALVAVNGKIAVAEQEATREFEGAHSIWKLKVLSARLGLVLPIWAVAAWLWARRRESRYITLLWGFWAFSIWMLIWGIGPYLPQYGGYIPLVVGAGATVWLSVSVLRYFNRRAHIRRRNIVDRAIARHCCPNCERDYLIGREVTIDLGLARQGTTRHFDLDAVRPRVCPACGLPLFAACSSCKHEQLVHLDCCSACGAPWPRLP